MLHRAHKERAWAALGYASWKAYCEAEFQMSERHSYRLLEFVEVKRVLTDQLVSPNSESQIRALVTLEPQQQSEAWCRAVTIADGEQPTAKQVEEAVTEVITPERERAELTPSNAMFYANKAIRCLEKISYNDPYRRKAINRVERWIGLHNYSGSQQ
jgi:hypothetical protein